MRELFLQRIHLRKFRGVFSLYPIFSLLSIKTIKTFPDESVSDIGCLLTIRCFPFVSFASSSAEMLSKGQTRRPNPCLTLALVLFSVFLLFDVAQATFKKPPFNGSIFGKRANGISDYDNAGRTLSSLCEVAVEACSVWFPQMEAKK